MEDERERGKSRVVQRRFRARHVGISTAILLAPACLLFGLFVVYPILASIRLSLYQWDGVGESIFIGLANYRELAADPTFRTALANNLRWLGCYLIAPAAGLGLFYFQSIRTGGGLVRALAPRGEIS